MPPPNRSPPEAYMYFKSTAHQAAQAAKHAHPAAAAGVRVRLRLAVLDPGGVTAGGTRAGSEGPAGRGARLPLADGRCLCANNRAPKC